jgi:hypothetical protein
MSADVFFGSITHFGASTRNALANRCAIGVTRAMGA